MLVLERAAELLLRGDGVAHLVQRDAKEIARFGIRGLLLQRVLQLDRGGRVVALGEVCLSGSDQLRGIVASAGGERHDREADQSCGKGSREMGGHWFPLRPRVQRGLECNEPGAGEDPTFSPGSDSPLTEAVKIIIAARTGPRDRRASAG